MIQSGAELCPAALEPAQTPASSEPARDVIRESPHITHGDRMASLEQVGWSLGNYCNARCEHCYSWQVRKSTRSLEPAEAAHILDALVEAGVKTVNLGGNEPIFTHGPNVGRSMLPAIIRAATSRGLVVGVTTNGTTALLLERIAPDAFERVGEWHVSIDSPFAEEHDRNRGGPYFALALEAMERIRARGRRLTVITCAMRWNATARHVAALFELARAHGADVRINTVKPTEPEHDALVLWPTEYMRYFREVARWGEPTVVGEPTLAARWGVPGEGCPCGTRSLRVNGMTPEGRVPVSPCVFLHDLRVGDLLTESLADLFERPEFAALRARRAQGPSACRARRCELLDTCRGGCAGRAVLQASSAADGAGPPGNPGIDPALWAALDRPDPYCPVDLPAEVGPGIARLPCALTVARDSMRVHAGYLCTVMASPRPAPAWSAETSSEPAAVSGGVARTQNTLPAAAWRAADVPT